MASRPIRVVDGNTYATNRDAERTDVQRKVELQRESVANWHTMAKILILAFEQANAGEVACDMTLEHSAAKRARTSDPGTSPI